MMRRHPFPSSLIALAALAAGATSSFGGENDAAGFVVGEDGQSIQVQTMRKGAWSTPEMVESVRVVPAPAAVIPPPAPEDAADAALPLVSKGRRARSLALGMDEEPAVAPPTPPPALTLPARAPITPDPELASYGKVYMPDLDGNVILPSAGAASRNPFDVARITTGIAKEKAVQVACVVLRDDTSRVARINGKSFKSGEDVMEGVALHAVRRDGVILRIGTAFVFAPTGIRVRLLSSQQSA